jgi:hypothetical protein
MGTIFGYLKKTSVAATLAFVSGLLIGLFYAWVAWPVNVVDTLPATLEATYKEDYLRMAIVYYGVYPDQTNAAVDHYKNLGVDAPQILSQIQQNPGPLPAVLIQNYSNLVSQYVKSEDLQPATKGSVLQWLVPILVVLAIFFIAFAAKFLSNLFRPSRPADAEATPAMQAQEFARQTERTDFEQMGLAPPITQMMTSYVMGDDLYDESFSIDSQAGEFLGEYGVGVSETIGVGDPKKVTALEVWLFDKNDIKTATKVLMSSHAYNDPTIRQRLEAKGELVLVSPQKQVILETATLQLLATIADLEYGQGPLPADSYFERVTLELAIWPRSDQQAPPQVNSGWG